MCRFADDGFEVTRNLYPTERTFQVIGKGRIVPDQEGSRVEVHFATHPLSVVLGVVASALMLSPALPIILGDGTRRDAPCELFVLGLMAAFFWALIAVTLAAETKLTQQILTRICSTAHELSD